ncbi:hypothetical protein [Actinomadura spongiicola]|nr:hypothetical protein [Actinomadura spongiicola]
MPANEAADEPGSQPDVGRGRRAAEALTWWTALLACYLALASTITLTEITVGAVTAAAGTAAAIAGRRALLPTGPTTGADGAAQRAADRAAARRSLRPARLLPPLARLPAQIAADTARVTVRGAGGGHWTRPAVAPGPAARGAATLLLSASPGTYVGGVDPDRGLLRVHRLAPGPSPFERRLERAGLIADPAPGRAPAPGAPPDEEPP